MSEETLSYFKLEGLYHFTHVDHIHSIFRYGLLSHNRAHNLGLVQHDISSTDVQHRRSQRSIGGMPVHRYVPLYFNPRNAMLFRIAQDFTMKNIVMLRLPCELMMQKGVWFTDGNAASTATLSYSSLNDLAKLDWDCLRAGYWSEYEDGRRKRMAEILIPNKISDSYIKRKSHLFAHDQEVKGRILAKVPNARVTVDRGLFFG